MKGLPMRIKILAAMAAAAALAVTGCQAPGTTSASAEVGSFGRVPRQVTDMTPHRFELPAKPFQRLCITPENQQLVYQTRHNVPAEG